MHTIGLKTGAKNETTSSKSDTMKGIDYYDPFYDQSHRVKIIILFFSEPK
jgi:hypothetical protein